MMKIPGWIDYDKECNVSALLGKTLTDVSVSDDKSEIIFSCDDGSTFGMWHRQDCCESVIVEDICGDLQDLIGSPVTLAEDATSGKDPEGYKGGKSEWRESFTWTFYKFATRKGYVDIRWLGESNGYYSEGVNFAELDPAK